MESTNTETTDTTVVSLVGSLASIIRRVDELPLSQEALLFLSDRMELFSKILETFYITAESDDTSRDLYLAASNVGDIGLSIGLALEKLDPKPGELLALSKEIGVIVEKIQNEVTRAGAFKPNNEPAKKQTPQTRTTDSEVAKLADTVLKEVEGRATTLIDRIAEIEKRVDSMEDSVEAKIAAFEVMQTDTSQRFEEMYNDAKDSLNSKQSELDKLIGTLSEGVIAGNYDRSAADEKKMADFLRYLSLGCMAVIALIVGYSLYETTVDAFKWENSLFRLVFTILLSVPATYLGRESARHRQQQYSHLQTSLDLKAISPYLATLPEEEQHKIKSEIAHRLFAPKTVDGKQVDAFPINSHELLSKLIDKMEFVTTGEDSKKRTPKEGS